MTSKARSLIAMFGALVYALAGVRLVLSSIAGLIGSTLPSPGSGGIGFVTETVDVIVVPYFLLAIASVVGNRMLVPWVKRSDPLVRTIHYGHTLTLILAFALPLIGTITFGSRPGTMSILFLSSGLSLGAHFLLAAALLGTYVLRPART